MIPDGPNPRDPAPVALACGEPEGRGAWAAVVKRPAGGCGDLRPANAHVVRAGGGDETPKYALPPYHWRPDEDDSAETGRKFGGLREAEAAAPSGAFLHTMIQSRVAPVLAPTLPKLGVSGGVRGMFA